MQSATISIAGKNLLSNSNGEFSVSLKAGAGPRHHVFHPSGKFLYVINELDSTTAAFRYNGKKGALNEIQTVSTLPSGFKGTNYPSEIAIHPSGKFLYGSNRGHDSIVVFRVNQRSGELSPVRHEPTLGKFPRHFEMDPDGNYLLAENQNSDNITVFQINSKTGALIFTGNTMQIEKPQCVKFVP